MNKSKIVARDYMGLPVPEYCPDCKMKLELEVLKSNAGYYLGRFCKCGPFSRESGYYAYEEVAENALRIRQTYNEDQEYAAKNSFGKNFGR